ncbi:BlaI/MecI/CopY family transcriptional regulator [Roseivirga sp. BDSF3-8]|uniref:BlaI/MecI/CopY family transcriptional regulator n=1 Tax=Roseivirga sp. BDSF3-8 TaxID=3241598 RepID=UPI003531B0B4
MTTKLTYPTESELEILQVLWQNGPNPVRFVNDKLNETRDTGYTTTLKMMQIMLEKGMLTRKGAGRQHIYEAVVREEETQQRLLDRFLDRAFGGSATKLVQALSQRRPDTDEVAEIRRILDQMEGGEK